MRVGVVSGLGWLPLFDALAEMHRDHPGVDLRLHEGNSADLVDQVRDGRVDVAVAAWSGDPPAGLTSSLLVDDALVAVVAPGHPWAARRSVGPAELAGADLIALSTGTGSRAALDRVLARITRNVEPRWEVSSPGHVRLLAQRDLGVGVVSETTAGEWADLAVLRIDDELARSQLGLLWRGRPGPAAGALLARLPKSSAPVYAPTGNRPLVDGSGAPPSAAIHE